MRCSESGPDRIGIAVAVVASLGANSVHMLFSFRSADAEKYPRLLNVQTMEMAFDEKGIARLIKQGLARYDEATNAVVFTEFEKPRVQVSGAASEWPDVIGGEGFIENPIMVSERVVTVFEEYSITGCHAKP